LERTLELKQDGGLLAGDYLFEVMKSEFEDRALQQQQDCG